MPMYDVVVEGTTYEVNAPDENTAWRWANYTHRQKQTTKPQPRTGIGAALGKGFESLIGTTTTATQAVTGDPNQAAELALKRAAASPYADQVSWEKVKELYGTQGAVAAALEVARQVPLAIAEQLPQLGASAGATYAGAKLGALTSPVTGPVGPIVGGGLGFLAGTLPSLLGSNIERQAQVQREAGQPLDIAMGRAVPAALAQTGLEAVGTLVPLGGRLVGKLFGPQVEALLQSGRKEAAEVLARESLGKLLAKGTAVGIAADVPTEVIQQVIERGQAGLDLLSEDALKEYGETAYATTLFAGPAGAAGRAASRSGARAEVSADEAAKEAEQRKAAAATEQARRASPDYLEKVFTNYDTLVKQETALKAQLKKESKEAPLSQEDKDANAILQKQLAELKTPLAQARSEYLAAGGPQALAKMRAGRLELTPPEGRVSEPAAAEETDEEKTARLRRDLPGLESLLERQLADVKNAATPEEALTLAERAAATRKAVETARTAAPAEPKIDEKELTARIKRLEKQYQDAREKGEEATVMKVVPELLAARKEAETLRTQREVQRMDTGLFAPEAIAAEEQRRVALGEEMGAGRETAAYERQQMRLEQETAREEAARRAAVDAELEAEGTAEREAMQGLAQDLAYKQRMRGYGELGREQQFELFPQPREKVEQKTADIAGEMRRLQEQIAELQKRRSEKEALPQEELAGALSREPGQIVDIDRRLAELRQRLEDLRESDLERRTVRVLPEAPQVDVRKKPKLAQQIAALTDRVLAAPGVDEQTKDVVRQVQADVPGFLRAATAQTAESVREQERRAAAAKAGAPAESTAAPTALFNPAQVAAWLYRTLATGRADPADTARALAVLRSMQAAPAAGQQRLASIRPAPMQEAMAQARKLREEKAATRAKKRETTRAEREEADAAKRRAEQASLEAGERAGVMVFFEKNKEDIMADTNYIALVEQAYDTSLSSQERMKAATEADKYMQEKQQRIEARAEKTSAASKLHEENLKNARDKLAKLKELRGTKRTDATKAKLEGAIKKQESVVAGHQAKLNKALTGTRITRMSRADLKAIRDQANAEIRRTLVPGERLGVVKGTQQRGIGPATRAEVVPPKTMRTGSEESRAGKTTTPARNRIQEARGVKQRDVPMTRKEQAEANMLAAENEVDAAKTLSEKRLAEAKLAVAEAQYEIAAKGDTNERAKRLAEAQADIDKLTLAKVRLSEKAPVTTEDKKGAEPLPEVASTKEEIEYEEPEIEILGGTREETFFARGVEVESPNLSNEQVQALQDNDVAQALASLSTDKSADRVHRAVAQRLAQLLDATDVEVKATLTDEEGNPVLGQALASGKKIRLSRAGGLTQEILLHEGTHAAAERVLAMPESELTPLQLAAKRELQALHAAVKRDPSITSADAKASLSEFVAEVMSNRNLQQQLAKKPWKLSDALRAFKSVILRLLGVKETESMLGAAMKSVDAIFMPTSVQPVQVTGVRTQYSQKDIAALHDGSNSMRQFAENFPQYIKQKDRTPADVDRIGGEYLTDMLRNPNDYIAPAEANKLNYTSDTIMSDGTVFDPNNPLHLVEATPATFVALKAQQDEKVRKKEAEEITENRIEALHGLLQLLGVRYAHVENTSYTLPEKALVAKAASKYGVQSTPEGRLKLVNIDVNNRHPVAVVSKEAADAVIEELRAGKSLKAAFLDGMQRIADANAKRNEAKNGWQKFEMAKADATTLADLYTEEEISEAFEQTGYDLEGDALIEQLIADGLLPDRRPLLKTAIADSAIDKAAVELNAGAAGTSWCTGASVSTARSQIRDGDFYIYYNKGKPEVAVRMDGTDKIGEIRGNTPNQWLTPEQQRIAEQFLRANTFKGADRFLEETERKAALTRFFKGEDDPTALKYISKTLSYDKTSFSEFGISSLFKFRALDGYASTLRPKVSDEINARFTERAKEALLDGAEKGYVNAPVDFSSNSDTGTYELFGKKRKIGAADLITAEDITTPYDIRGVKVPFVLPKLQTVENFNMFIDTELPALKNAEKIIVFTENAVTLKVGKDAFITELTGYAKDKSKEGTRFTLKSGTYVGVRPVTEFYGDTEFSVLNATIEAPYVKVFPYNGKQQNPPEARIVTPNKLGDTPPVEMAGAAAEDRLLFARSLPVASRVANQIVGEQKGWLQSLKDNFLGMGGRTQFVDKLAPSEEALKRGGADPTKAMQAMFYLRMYDQRMHFTSQAITEGVPERVEKTRRDGTKEFLIEAKPGANLKTAFNILARKDVVKEAGSADAANKLVTLYMAAIRGERVGYDTLNFGRVWAEGEIKRIEGELRSPTMSTEQRSNLTKRRDALSKRLDKMPTPADIKAAKAEIDTNPVLRDAFNEVRDIYNQYNRDLINFNVQQGAISRETANKLLQQNDYIPYYRLRDGVAELMIGKETPIRIGNLKDSPHLQELVGGDEPILDFITSSVQNTSMLIDMATHNLAVKNLMFEFRDLGLATIGKVKGGKAPTGAVSFKVDGVEHFGVVNTEALGISSDLLVKGLAGIPTMFPAFIRAMGVPSRLLRRLIVASPVYWARQVFRDSTAAAIASGADITPVLSAIKQIGKPSALERRGITGGAVFTGMPEDAARMIKEMQAGKISVTSGLSWLEAKAAQADALTRRAQYESYLKQGRSEMEATYMALESMNFSRRGLSPTMHMVGTMIPFFNAQIQGLDVLYRSFRGQMPMNERLKVRKKLWERGMMLFGLSMAYALAMQDDEAYKNAKPEEKYGNWFVPLDMFGIKESLRLPIPFEIGYIFKALPEALVNTLANEKGGEEALKALKHIAQQTVPGGSSYLIPQAFKPGLEVLFGTSLYTGRGIESGREQAVEPGYRTRESTTALAAEIGEMMGFSPIKLEFLINGYTGQLGMAALAALSAPFGGTGKGPEPATKRITDLPVLGTLFQPADASGIIDLTYDRMNKVRQAQDTYKRLVNEGKLEKAATYAKEKADELSLASLAGQFRERMGELTEYERQIRASALTPDQKRERLDRVRQVKIDLSKRVQAVADRRTPQASPA